jgi:RNA polymerase sigma-70 factor (ECF subfamily)
MGTEANTDAMSDEEVVKQVLAGEITLFEILMHRYNQRLYRVARAILGDDSEAEDVMQDSYVRAYAHLNQFAGEAKFSTWLTKIAVHEALARVRRRDRFVEIDSTPASEGDSMSIFISKTPDPEQQVLAWELNAVLEAAVDTIPEIYRSVFMLREIEEMSTAETAECLDISEEAVKTRLHRARALLREELYARIGIATTGAFQFAGPRCDRVVSVVFDRIRVQQHQDLNPVSPMLIHTKDQ